LVILAHVTGKKYPFSERMHAKYACFYKDQQINQEKTDDRSGNLRLKYIVLADLKPQHVNFIKSKHISGMAFAKKYMNYSIAEFCKFCNHGESI